MYWRNLSDQELLDGEAVSVYIDGPDENGQRAGEFYELETLSPALVLLPGESFVHRNCIYHLRGDLGHIGDMCCLFLNAGVDEIDEFPSGRRIGLRDKAQQPITTDSDQRHQRGTRESATALVWEATVKRRDFIKGTAVGLGLAVGSPKGFASGKNQTRDAEIVAEADTAPQPRQSTHEMGR